MLKSSLRSTLKMSLKSSLTYNLLSTATVFMIAILNSLLLILPIEFIGRLK